MEQIYFALVDTPGLFAGIIRRVTKCDYVHVALSLDEELTEAYSVGRRNPFVPFLAGFEKEDAEKIARKFPAARYRILRMECRKWQKEAIAAQLRQCYKQRSCYHYCILGLPFLLAGKPFYQKGHYTCSSFTARLLEEQGIVFQEKHFSLVTPRDFYEWQEPEVIYEGPLKTWLDRRHIPGLTECAEAAGQAEYKIRVG